MQHLKLLITLIFTISFFSRSHSQQIHFDQSEKLKKLDSICFSKADTQTGINMCAIEKNARWQKAQQQLNKQIDEISKGTKFEAFFKKEREQHDQYHNSLNNLSNEVQAEMTGTMWQAYFLDITTNQTRNRYKRLAFYIQQTYYQINDDWEED